MQTLTIYVTKKDIQKSKKLGVMGGTCNKCPIYNAISRHKELLGCSVGMTNIYGHNNGQIFLPSKAARLSHAAYNLDWKNVKPIKFQVRLP